MYAVPPLLTGCLAAFLASSSESSPLADVSCSALTTTRRGLDVPKARAAADRPRQVVWQCSDGFRLTTVRLAIFNVNKASA